MEEIITLPPPPLPHSTTNEPSIIQPESSSRVAPLMPTIQSSTQNDEDRIRAPWPRGIQYLAMALTQVDSLLKEPRLSVLIAKNSLRPSDRHRLGTIETDKLYGFIWPWKAPCVYAYLAKEWSKDLRREFGAQEMDKNLLHEECSQLKARVTEMESIMKKTLESIDKLQVDLDETNIVKAIVEALAKAIEDQVANLQCNYSLKFKKAEPPRTGLQSWRWSIRTQWRRVVRCSSRAKTISRRSCSSIILYKNFIRSMIFSSRMRTRTRTRMGKMRRDQSKTISLNQLLIKV